MFYFHYGLLQIWMGAHKRACWKNLPKFNPFIRNVHFLYPPKTSENQRFSDIFRGYKKGKLRSNGVKWNALFRTPFDEFLVSKKTWKITLSRNSKKYKRHITRSSHRRCFVRKGVLRNFAKFKGKQLCQSPFFNKAAD